MDPRARRSVLRVACGFVLCAGAAAPALAQGAGRTMIVTVNYGLQADTERLAEEIELEKYIEPASVTATMAKKGLPFFDIGATLRIAGNAGVHVALSYVSNTDAASVSAEIPHPLYLDRPRTISGQVAGVSRRETAFHTNIAYIVDSPSIALVLSGGPSFFSIEQDFVTDVTFTETYPFDTATFSGATLTHATASKTGYNVAADVVWKAGRSWGIGGLIRYSRASVPFTAAGVNFGTLTVGGLQAGGGLRLMF